jgi:hypothetical protein
MNKEYLIQEIIEGLGAVKPFPDSLKEADDNESLLKTFDEIEMELEHVMSCIATLKSELK